MRKLISENITACGIEDFMYNISRNEYNKIYNLIKDQAEFDEVNTEHRYSSGELVVITHIYYNDNIIMTKF